MNTLNLTEKEKAAVLVALDICKNADKPTYKGVEFSASVRDEKTSSCLTKLTNPLLTSGFTNDECVFLEYAVMYALNTPLFLLNDCAPFLQSAASKIMDITDELLYPQG